MKPLEPKSEAFASDKYLTVSAGLELILISADEILIQFGLRSYPSELLRDTELRGIIGKLICPLLSGPQRVGDLLSNIPELHHTEAQEFLSDLIKRGVLSDVLCSPVDQYLSYTFLGESSIKLHTVSLIGAGPIGGRIIQSLLQHGIQKIKVLDERIADDLWHSYMPAGLTIDRNDRRPAHIVLCDALAKRGYTGLEPITAALDASGVQEALAGADFLVLALEQQDLRLAHLVNRFCLRESKPWLIAMIDGNLGLAGPLFIPRQTACYNDFTTLIDSANPSAAMNRKHRQHILRRGHASFFAGLPSYADIVAGYASLATVHFLLRNSSYLLARVLIIDFDKMLLDVEDVLKLPRCPVCGMQKNVYRPPFSAEIATPT